MKIIFTFLIWLLSVVSIHAQNKRVLELEIKNEDGKYYIETSRINNDLFGTFSVMIKFESLTNINSPRVITWSGIIPGRIATLSPINRDQSYSYGRYYYSYIRGDYRKKPNPDFVYRLPFGTSRDIHAYELTNINEEYFDEAKRETWKAWQFMLQKGDTVYASRKGVVVEIIDGNQQLEIKGNISYTSRSNSILIEHSDGTLAKYDVLEAGSIAVKINDVVYPDTPLALAGSYDSEKYQARLMIYYPRYTIKKSNNQNHFYFEFIDPIFATTKGNIKLLPREEYRSVLTNEIIRKEMTKKETQKIAK